MSIASKPPSFDTTNGDVIAYAEELHEHAAAPHKPWTALVARLLRAACPDTRARVTSVAIANFSLDPLEPIAPEPLRQSFVLATGGSDPGLDSLAILIAVLKGLEPDERAACLAYITSRFMGEAP